ncbi:MAG: protein kinase [Archangiaceae bacterium]|nr:protein kinase [Archangiaceae bacterium]
MTRCPDDEVLARFAEGGATAHERTELDAHLDQCALCRGVLVGVVDAVGPVADATVSASAAAAAPRGSGLELGQQVGRYVVERVLGSGAMGVVVAARDTELKRTVALKVVHSDASEVTRARLLREAQALARVRHPNVVVVHEVVSHGAVQLIALELVTGMTLRRYLEVHVLSWREKVRLFAAAGCGLHAAHLAGLVHRDFKADNVLVSQSGEVKVTDFGLARHEVEPEAALDPDRSVELTDAQSLLGTPRYMSPEQLNHQRADARSDQFSFCVALWEALSGARLFNAREVGALRREVMSPRIGALTHVPRALTAALQRGLSLDPAARWPSLELLVRELERIASRRQRWLKLLLAGAALGAALVAGGAVNRGLAQRRCGDGPARAAVIWSDARKHQLEQVFTQTGAAYAASALAEVQGEVDAFVARWRTSFESACEASVRGSQPPAQLEARTRCLSRRLDDLDTFLGELAHVDAQTLASTSRAARGLGTVASCDDVATLLQQEAPAAEVRPRLDAVYRELAAVRTRARLGQLRDAARQLGEVEPKAAQLGPGPRAEALVLDGELKDELGEFAAADQALQAGALAAERARHYTALASALIARVHVVGVSLAHGDDALHVAERAEAVLAPMDNWELATELDYQRAFVLVAAKRPVEAVERAERALATSEQREPGAERGERLRELLARALWMKGDVEAGSAQYERVLQQKRARYGDRHPALASALTGLAIVYADRGDLRKARARVEEGLQVLERAVGPDSPTLVRTLNVLAGVATMSGEMAEAERHVRRALKLNDAARGADHPLSLAMRVNLGSMLIEQDQVAEGLGVAREAVALSEKRWGPTQANTATTRYTLCAQLELVGQHREAAELCERVVPELAAAYGEGTAKHAYGLATAAAVKTSLGETAQARASAERAAKLLEEQLGPTNPAMLDPLRTLGAVALAESRLDDAEALVERCRRQLGAEGSPIDRARIELLAARVLRARGQTQKACATARAAAAALPHPGLAGREVSEWLAAQRCPP